MGISEPWVRMLAPSFSFWCNFLFTSVVVLQLDERCRRGVQDPPRFDMRLRSAATGGYERHLEAGEDVSHQGSEGG
jgi:hypothetical protein